MMNEELDAILDLVEDAPLREALKERLYARDQVITEKLLMEAANQGLAASITRLLILRAGLGAMPEDAEMGLLIRQANAEHERLAHIAQEIQRRLGGLDGG